MTNIVSQDGDKYKANFHYKMKGITYNPSYYIKEEEYYRFKKEKTFPITVIGGIKFWSNEDGFFHRIDGPAVIFLDPNDYDYYYNGFLLTKEEWFKVSVKRVYFLRKKIIILKKLIEIPELFQEVYYTHKNMFLSLLNKI